MTRPGSTVHGALVDGEDRLPGSVDALLDAVNADDVFRGAKKAIIKPNCVIDEHWHRGNVTCPVVVEAIVARALEANPGLELIVGDGGFTRRTTRTFEINGYPALCKRHGARLVDFNAAPKVEVTLPGATRLTGPVSVARDAVEADLIVSVAALKTHSLATTTLSMKNFMGLLGRKNIMHAGIHEKIVDLYSCFREKAPFAIIDGFIGSDGYECGGSPVNHGILLASTDLVALDATGTRLMRQPVERCEYLRIAGERGFGIPDAAAIATRGFAIDQASRSYAPG